MVLRDRDKRHRTGVTCSVPGIGAGTLNNNSDVGGMISTFVDVKVVGIVAGEGDIGLLVKWGRTTAMVFYVDRCSVWHL